MSDDSAKVAQLTTELAAEKAKTAQLESLVAALKKAAASGSSSVAEENVKLKGDIEAISAASTRSEKLLFSMSRERKTAKSGQRTRSSMTLKRQAVRHAEVAIVKDEVVRWLNDLLKPNPAVTTAGLFEELSTGIVLCKLILKIKPSVPLGRIHEKATLGTFYAHENVKSFLKGCDLLGMAKHDQFETQSLVGAEKNARAIVHCLLSLARLATFYGVGRFYPSAFLH